MKLVVPKLIMQSPQLAMVMMVSKTTILSETLGAQHGENKVTSEWQPLMETVYVVLPQHQSQSGLWLAE